MIPRLVLAVAAAAYLLLPAPTPLSTGGLLAVLGGLAAVQAVRRPGSVAALGVLLIGLAGLLQAGDLGPLRAVAFGVAGLLVHQAAALAAAVPARARIPARVLRLWAVRSAGGAVLGVAAVALTAPLAGQPNASGPVVLGLVALALVLGLPALVGRPVRRSLDP